MTKKIVLVMEDDPSVRATVRGTLEEAFEDIEVFETERSKAFALIARRRGKVDFIFCDIDTLQTDPSLRRIKESWPAVTVAMVAFHEDSEVHDIIARLGECGVPLPPVIGNLVVMAGQVLALTPRRVQ